MGVLKSLSALHRLQGLLPVTLQISRAEGLRVGGDSATGPSKFALLPSPTPQESKPTRPASCHSPVPMAAVPLPQRAQRTGKHLGWQYD